MQQSTMAALNEDRKYADEEHKRTMAAYRSRAPITQRTVADHEAERIAGYRAGIDRPWPLDNRDKFHAARQWFNHGHFYSKTKGMLGALLKRYKSAGAVDVAFSSDFLRVIVRAELGGHLITLATYTVSYAPDGSCANVMVL